MVRTGRLELPCLAALASETSLSTNSNTFAFLILEGFQTPGFGRFRYGAGGENRTLTKLPSVDFESTASTVPPLQLIPNLGRGLQDCRKSKNMQALFVWRIFFWLRLKNF